ncbi:response regulator [Gammaproteobacteria bacterium]|nr:response regulator [Gammaproteobacteria bacterium]
MAKTPTILIVDDEPFNRDLISQELDVLGVDTVSAASGREAIEMIGERRCDAMLLDIMMPGMSGYDVLQWLRDDNRLADLPVIVISAVDDMESVVRCIEMGAEDYLTKPFDPILLKARLHATLEKKQLRDKVKQQLAITRKVFGKFVPEHIAEAILDGQGVLEPALSVATILYADIEGFTSLVASMPPPKVVDMLNEYFAALTRPLDRHGGVLTQFQGDAILVTFNVPVPDPAHADNAVQVAFEIQRTLKERTFAGNRLRTRIGIATGEVVSGSVGSGDRINYTVQGNAVNLAARLEELNKQYGSYTLISGDTVAALTRKYTTKALGEIEVRGMQAPVAVHRLEV